MIARRTVLSLLLAAAAPASAAPPAPVPPALPGEPVNYAPLAFYPDAWRKNKIPFTMVPWTGQSIVLLTNTKELDGRVMARFLERLDGGWKVYADIIGVSPKPLRQIGEKPVICAVPSFYVLDGAYARGYVGFTGIEAGGFYVSDYPMVQKNPVAFPPYYFYEMGRNYFLFGNRHSCFTTGFAVFMRYVCMDTLKCTDTDMVTRRNIESAEALYAKTSAEFLPTFTNAIGLGEKQARVRLPDGSMLSPSDQPVMYASAMLKLWRENGRNEWARRFFAALMTLPESSPDHAPMAHSRSVEIGMSPASVAAKRDLSRFFVTDGVSRSPQRSGSPPKNLIGRPRTLTRPLCSKN